MRILCARFMLRNTSLPSMRGARLAWVLSVCACAKCKWSASNKTLPIITYCSSCVRLRAGRLAFSLVGRPALRSLPSFMHHFLIGSTTLRHELRKHFIPPFLVLRPLWGIGSPAFRALNSHGSALHVRLRSHLIRLRVGMYRLTCLGISDSSPSVGQQALHCVPVASPSHALRPSALTRLRIQEIIRYRLPLPAGAQPQTATTPVSWIHATIVG